MNSKEKIEIKQLHDKISCVDNKLDKFLTNEWVHEVVKTSKMLTDISWLKKYFWVIMVALLGLLFKAWI